MERSKKNNISICVMIFACLVEQAVSAQVDNKNPTTVNSSTTMNDLSTDFFVLISEDKILTRPYFSKNATLSEIEIADSLNPKHSTTKEYITGFFSDCSNKMIYVLKKSTVTSNKNQYLDIIQYDWSKKFTRIHRNSRMFNKATSASLDWTTGNIYWIDYDKKTFKYSMKSTNKLFEEPKYIIQPTEKSMEKIQVYPKRKEIFFSDGTSIWYISTLPNSIARLLFSSETDSHGVFALVIDQALGKLWWNDYVTLYSVDISDSTRPLSVQRIESQELNGTIFNLSAFNNTLYWLAVDNYERDLYIKKGNDEPEKIASNVGTDNKLSVFSLNCL